MLRQRDIAKMQSLTLRQVESVLRRFRFPIATQVSFDNVPEKK